MKRICSFSNATTFYITMGDSEKAQQPSKKRAAQKELSRDNPGLDVEECTSALENGTFKIASEEVLASRRIIEVKLKDPSLAPAPASNPFAGIRLVPCTAPAPAAETTKPLSGSNSSPSKGKLEIHDDGRSDTTKEINVSSEKEKSEAVNTGEGDKTKTTIEDAAGEEETKKTKDGCEDTEKDTEKNGDWGWSGVFTGLCRPPLFLAGKVPREGTKTTTIFPSKQDVLVETGEENEKAVFNADSILYEYLEGGWKERGIGELKVNVSTTDSRKARLVMRSKGNYRLILNASLYPEMKLAEMDKKGITFACVNSASEAKNGLSTFALKFKDLSVVSEFRAVIEEHKDGKTTTVAVEA